MGKVTPNQPKSDVTDNESYKMTTNDKIKLEGAWNILYRYIMHVLPCLIVLIGDIFVS